jgi:hypothetical protein
MNFISAVESSPVLKSLYVAGLPLTVMEKPMAFSRNIGERKKHSINSLLKWLKQHLQFSPF